MSYISRHLWQQYQDICPQVTGKPQSVMLPSAFIQRHSCLSTKDFCLSTKAFNTWFEVEFLLYMFVKKNQETKQKSFIQSFLLLFYFVTIQSFIKYCTCTLQPLRVSDELMGVAVSHMINMLSNQLSTFFLSSETSQYIIISIKQCT